MKVITTVLAASAISLGVLVSPATAAGGSDDAARARAASSTPVAASDSWRRYVLDSPTPTVGVRKVEVERGADAVEAPDALRAADGRSTTIKGGLLQPTRLMLDLGVNVGGRVEVGITAGQGVAVHLAYAEARRYMTVNGDILGSGSSTTLGANDDPDGRTDDIVVDGPASFVSPGIRGAQRWIALDVLGPGSVSIDYVRVRVTHLRPKPTDYVGRFVSSDAQLNRVWWGSAYTWNIATFADEAKGTPTVVTDAGKRDRLAWLGDLAIEDLMGQYGLRQAPRIVRDTIDLFSCQQESDGYIPMLSQIDVVCDEPGPADGPPKVEPLTLIGRLPEYTAWWVIAVDRYVHGQADRAFGREMLPVVRRAIDYYRANLRDGVFVTQNRLGLPNVINWHPYDLATGVDAHTQAVWYRALRSAQRLEAYLGSATTARQDASDAASLRTAAIDLLWDDEVGALRLNAPYSMSNHPYDAQAEGVLSGLLTGTKADRAIAFVQKHLMTPLGPLNGESDTDPFMSNYISPYIASDDLLGRFKNGDGAAALDLMRRLYGYMIDHDPKSTMWEKLRPDGTLASYSPNGLGAGVIPDQVLFLGRGSTSMAHPWSGGSMPALSEYVAGLQQVSPGWRRWRIAPQLVDLTWAQGQVGTPQGALASRWIRRDGVLRLTVVAPSGTAGVVRMPVNAARATVALDGVVVWRDGRAAAGSGARRGDGGVVVPVGSGRHTLASVGSGS